MPRHTSKQSLFSIKKIWSHALEPCFEYIMTKVILLFSILLICVFSQYLIPLIRKHAQSCNQPLCMCKVRWFLLWHIKPSSEGFISLNDCKESVFIIYHRSELMSLSVYANTIASYSLSRGHYAGKSNKRNTLISNSVIATLAISSAKSSTTCKTYLMSYTEHETSTHDDTIDYKYVCSMSS